MAATPKEVKEFFGFTNSPEFIKDWKELSDQDKIDLKEGIGNGSLNY